MEHADLILSLLGRGSTFLINKKNRIDLIKHLENRKQILQNTFDRMISYFEIFTIHFVVQTYQKQAIFFFKKKFICMYIYKII
jgi:hypothetical protein